MPRELLRPLLPLLALGLFLGMRTASAPPQARRQVSLSDAVVYALVQQGWIAESVDVLWVDRPYSRDWTPESHPRAIVRAHRRDEPSDVLLIRTRVSPEGRLLAVTEVDNLSDTAAVDEDQVRVAGNRVAWTVSVSGETTAVHLADLSGAKPPAPGDMNWLERMQLRLTWLQETGQSAGIRKQEFRIEPPAKQVKLLLDGAGLSARIDDATFRLTPGSPPTTRASRIVELPETLGHPGNLITWAVDRVRALPGFGNDRMQLAKSLAFEAIDRLERLRGQITRDNGGSSLNEELGQLLESSGPAQTDPESGWPPAAITPVLKEPLEREGQWLELNRDPFVSVRAGSPTPFLFSFIRTDRERQYTKVFIVLWDPRHVELHTMSGTREPKTATGETGPGQVPRDDAILSTLVGAFNGGFQATHGEFGMMADGIVYLPPKPYAATVARLSDGSTGFGTWPVDDAIPDNVTSFRQNLTPLLVDEQENPYHRTWWGGVPPGWEDATRTVRTGICLTREGFVGYFYGSSIDSTHLATAMRSARCQYGLQLDMNPGHTGFEFYRIGRKGTLPDLGRKLESQWEAKGEVPNGSDWEFMSRRMIRYMNLMHFPRYIRTESRDFFYLTERRLLPLGSLKPLALPPEPGEGDWQTKGLPQRGWPAAIATSRYRPDPSHPNTRVTLIAIDCNWLQLAKPSESNTAVVAFEQADSANPSSSLWYWNGTLRVQGESPGHDAQRVLSGTENATRKNRVSAAIGQASDSIWIYAEVSGSTDHSRDVEMLDRTFAKVGAVGRLYFGQPINVRFGDHAPLGAVAFVRRKGPQGIRIFEQTPFVAPKEWMPLQERRIRYIKQPKAARPPLGDEPHSPAPGDLAKDEGAKTPVGANSDAQP